MYMDFTNNSHMLLSTHFQCWQSGRVMLLNHTLVVDEPCLHSYEPKLKQKCAGVAVSCLTMKCTMQSVLSESDAHSIIHLSETCTPPSLASFYTMACIRGTVMCVIRYGLSCVRNKQNCWYVVSFYSRIIQHCLAIMMCKASCRIRVGWCICNPFIPWTYSCVPTFCLLA
jgi:hypothetical protein